MVHSLLIKETAAPLGREHRLFQERQFSVPKVNELTDVCPDTVTKMTNRNTKRRGFME